MIIRILSEGQFDVPDSEVDRLNELDSAVESAIDSGDDDAFRDALAQLLGRVRETGQEVALDALVPSDLVLPDPSATLAEVRDLLKDDGLIPG